MEVPNTQLEVSSTELPLAPEEPPSETHLNHALRRLETFLSVFGFCQFSLLSFAFSWLSFLLLGIALPLLIIKLFNCSGCERYQIASFEFEILFSEALVAAISLLCISHNFRKYGVRRFLFVDRQHGSMAEFHSEYVKKINILVIDRNPEREKRKPYLQLQLLALQKDFFRLLALWFVPCFLLKTVREVIHIVYLYPNSWWQSFGLFFASLIPWSYLTIIFLSGSSLFNLVCNLQVIHFDHFGKLLERDLDISLYIEEHSLLTHHLSKISHRFRIFLLLELLVVTASQCVALLQTTGNQKIINFINGGDFVVASIYELAGIVLCLQAAAKISHRAQGLASVTSKWHALVTCNSSNGNLEPTSLVRSLPITDSENDVESAEYEPLPANSQSVSHTSLYQKRQAFVMYLQSNPRGVTIFGWTIDRTLIGTIFFVELSLVLFVLGKTITFTSS